MAGLPGASVRAVSGRVPWLCGRLSLKDRSGAMRATLTPQRDDCPALLLAGCASGSPPAACAARSIRRRRQGRRHRQIRRSRRHRARRPPRPSRTRASSSIRCCAKANLGATKPCHAPLRLQGRHPPRRGRHARAARRRGRHAVLLLFDRHPRSGTTTCWPTPSPATTRSSAMP